MADPVVISADQGEVICDGTLTFSANRSAFTGDVTCDGTLTPVLVSYATNLYGDVTTDGFIKTYKGYKSSPAIWLARPQTTDFTVYDRNKPGPIGATRTLMESSGYVYQCLKLHDQMIYYGQYSIMAGKYVINIAPAVSIKTIHNVGLIGKNAVCVNNPYEPTAHYAIDKRGMLLVFGDGAKVKDYSNQFAVLGVKTVLMYDPRLDVVRIADGTHGFTYSVKDDALGWGPPNITGCGLSGSTFYIVAPSTITPTPMNCKTDILDLGSRGEKTIYELDFGTNISKDLYAAIDYRWDKGGQFFSTPWIKADRNGRAFFMCSGIEFQIKWKLTTYSYMRLDYLPVRVKFADGAAVGNA